ncbi:uncharacterized protein LOC144133700 [Amblyomma americanum]
MPCAFQDLVFLLQEHVVLMFKILQLHYDDPHKVRFEDRRRRHLNRRLTATMKRLSGVHVLNHEHRFLDASGEPMLSLFAADRYHVARRHGHRPQCAFVPLQWQVQGKSGHDNSATTICPLGSLSAVTSFPESVQRAGVGG